jgi:xanthine phosphoribosyltransferase
MNLNLSWAEIERDAHALADWLRQGPPIVGLIAVSRGGLIPAALIARDLDVRMVESIAVATYEGKQAGQPRLLKPAAVNDQGEGWVIVDDLVDRGHTARFVRALLPRARFVCLYAKPEGRPFADKVIGDFEQQVWLKFPWEIGE